MISSSKAAGQVIVARFKGNGEAEAGVFLVDVHCLGVKDAFFTQTKADSYQHLLDRIWPDRQRREAMCPACARRLVEEAVAYAARLGLSPHPDYRLGCRVFGGIETSQCTSQFTFGREGKPFYIQGPQDSPRFVQNVLTNLHARCGEGNYHYLVLG